MRSWSFSSLMNYERCPHTLSFPFINLAEDKASCEAAQRGFDVHKLLATWLLDSEATKEPEFVGIDFSRFDLQTLKSQQPIVEKKFGFTEEWKETNYREAWLKVIPDALIIGQRLTIIDYKTGKRQYKEIKHAQQMQISACAFSAIYPNYLAIDTELWYLDEGKKHCQSYAASRLNSMRLRLHNRALTMLSDTELRPKPNKSNCRFCNFKERCKYAYEE